MLNISNQAYGTFVAEKRGGYVGQTSSAIRETLGNETAHLSDAELSTRIETAIAECRAAGLASPTAVARYAALSCVYGKGFAQAPEFSSAKPDFANRGLTDEARLNALQDAAPDQRLRLSGGTGLVDWGAAQAAFRRVWPMDLPLVEEPIQNCPGTANSTCCIRQLLVRCGHADRAYVMKLPGPKGATPPLFELISGDDGTDKLELAMSGGPCSQGRDAPYIELVGPGLEVRNKTELSETLSVQSQYTARQMGRADFWDMVTSAPALARTYQVSVTGCEIPPGMGVTVHIYPKYEVKVALGLEVFSGDLEDGEGGFSLKVSGAYLGHKLEYTFDFFDAIAALLRLILRLREDAQEADDLGGAYFDAEKAWSIKVLHGSVSGAIAPAERVGAPTIYRKGTLTFALDPLVEIAWTKDIFPPLARRIGAFGGVFGALLAEVVVKAWERWRASPASTVRARLDLVITGKIATNLAYSADTDGWNLAGADSESTSALGIKFEIVGEVKAKAAYLKVLFSGDSPAKGVLDTALRNDGDIRINATAASEIRGELKAVIVNKVPGTSGQIVFTGLEIKMIAAADVGRTMLGALPVPKPGLTSHKLEGEAEMGKYVLIEEHRWPADPEPKPLVDSFDA